jgi:hypothetical protein
LIWSPKVHHGIHLECGGESLISGKCTPGMGLDTNLAIDWSLYVQALLLVNASRM